MSSVANFIAEQMPATQTIMQQLYVFLIATSPIIRCRLSYGVPFFYGEKGICYLNPLKAGGVELGFVYAKLLGEAQGYLDFKGRKQIGGITILSADEIPFDSINEVLQRAIALDQAMAVMRANKRSKR